MLIFILFIFLKREWSSSNCHHVIQEYLAQVDYAGGQAKVTPICDSFRTGICAMISQCSEEQLKRIHYLAMSGGKNHFKQLREVYLREFKYKGKA